MPRIAIVAALLALVLAASASAQSPTATSGAVDRAVASLTADPVFVAPGAEPGLSEAERDSVRRAIRQSEAGPVYVAVVAPEAVNEAGGDPAALLREIATTLRRPGTYVLASGTELRAASTLLERGRAGVLATEAVEARRGAGLAATLRDLIDRVGEERRDPGGRDSGGGGVPGWLLLALIGIPAGLFGLRSFRRGRERREAYAAEMQEVTDTARQDVVALGDDIRALDLDVEMPGVDSATREDYSRALGAYERASQALDRARDPDDFAVVTESVEEGRYAIVAAKARLEGRQPPERRPPCFFDPRHGPSVRDVEWAPPGGAPRPVPACAADAVTLEEGRDPAMREVMVGGQPTPYWNASPAYGGWAGGFYGGFGGMGFLPGMLFGTMLGGAMGGFGPDVAMGDGGGFGDFGGDFGGGDFGGGGFGDFGGGDFGGGDF
ncbi:MAG TPA: hypothetical protein VF715_04415 [Thermoleophilaceae bacterium]